MLSFYLITLTKSTLTCCYTFPVFREWHDNQIAQCAFRSFRYLFLWSHYGNTHLYCWIWSPTHESDM